MAYFILVTMAVSLAGIGGSGLVIAVVLGTVLLVCAVGAFVSWALSGTLPRAEVESGEATVRWCVERELSELPPEVESWDFEIERAIRLAEYRAEIRSEGERREMARERCERFL